MLDQTDRVESTMGTPARFAVAQRSTAECLGLFAAAQRLFERRGVDFHLVAFETAAERGVEGLIASEWDYIEIGVIPLVGLRADGYDPAIVVGTTAMNTNFLMGRRNITRVVELAGGRLGACHWAVRQPQRHARCLGEMASRMRLSLFPWEGIQRSLTPLVQAISTARSWRAISDFSERYVMACT